MSRLKNVSGVLFVVALAVFLVASNVRLALNSLPLYEFGFRRYDVASATGLSTEQLSQAARQIRDYFNSHEKLLDVRIPVDTAARALFGEREILHMRDVKGLVEKTYRVQEGAFLYLFLFVTLGFFLLGRDFGGRVRRLSINGSLITLLFVGVVGVGSLMSFGPLFVLFHQVSFSNELWQLDPYSSYLVMMFPEGFWRDATLLIGAASVAEAIGIVLLLLLITGWLHWRRRVAQSKAPQFG